MERSRYLEIRNSIDLNWSRSALLNFLAINFALMATVAVLLKIFSGSWLQACSVPFIVMFMYRNFSLMHEATHSLVSKNSFVNDLFGAIAGAFCLLSFESWKQAHLEHHHWSGNIDKDPVMAMVKIFPNWPKALQNFFSFCWRLWIPILSTLQHIVFWAICLKHYAKGAESKSDFMSIIFPVLIYGGIFALMPTKTIALTIFPSIYAYLILTEVVNAPHHLGLPQYRGETKLPIWDQYLIARSCIYPKWLARLVILNFNYHTEHHMFPYVPWYHLDKLHTVVTSELGDHYNTDPQFAWIIKNRKSDLRSVIVTTEITAEKKAA